MWKLHIYFYFDTGVFELEFDTFMRRWLCGDGYQKGSGEELALVLNSHLTTGLKLFHISEGLWVRFAILRTFSGKFGTSVETSFGTIEVI